MLIGGGPVTLRAWRRIRRISRPSMYSIEMKYSLATRPSSKIWTMLTWFRSDASFASRTNDLMKLASSARCGKRRLSATMRSKPSMPRSSARCTVAIPPTPSLSYTRYGPNCSSAWSGSAGISVSPRLHRLASFVGGLHVQRERVDRPLHLLGESGHHYAVPLDQRLAGEHFRHDRRLPVVLGPGQVLELDHRVGNRGPDLRGDVVWAHFRTPSSAPTALNAVIARSTSSKLCAADSWTRIRAWPRGTTGKANPIT